MEKTLLIIVSIILIVWAVYSFYLIFKKYGESDDPLLGTDTFILLDLLIAAISWIAEKFFSDNSKIILFKLFCLIWGLMLIGFLLMLWGLILYRLFFILLLNFKKPPRTLLDQRSRWFVLNRTYL